jgi:hypothetical protein
LKPEEYVNQLRELNGGRQTVQLKPEATPQEAH